MLDDISKILSSDAAAVLDAPVSFSIIVIAVAIAIWWAVSRHFSGVVNTLRERNQAKDEKIADYKEKLQGAEPDEARALIKSLEDRLEKLEPRRLSDSTIEEMSSKLRLGHGHVRVSVEGTSSVNKPLFIAIATAFDRAGWNVTTSTVLGPSNPPACGLKVTVGDLNKPSALDKIVFFAMDSMKIPYEKQGGLFFHPHDNIIVEILVADMA